LDKKQHVYDKHLHWSSWVEHTTLSFSQKTEGDRIHDIDKAYVCDILLMNKSAVVTEECNAFNARFRFRVWISYGDPGAARDLLSAQQQRKVKTHRWMGWHGFKQLDQCCCDN
jgi:hypothetical protein